MRTHAHLLALFALVAVPVAAEARSTVLKKDGANVYVDVGTDEGVVAGATLALHHVISVVHPVTKKRLRDTFVLGTMKVVSAGRTLCVAAASPELAARVAVGDEVDLASPSTPWHDPWREDEPAEATAAVRRDDPAAAAQAKIAAAEAVSRTFDATLGRSIEERIAIWNGFLTANPQSPFVGGVKRELAALTAQRDVEASLAEEAAEAGRAGPAAALAGKLEALAPHVMLAGPLAWTPPTRAYEGAPVPFAFLILRPEGVRAAWLSYRTVGEATFHRAALVVEGDTLRGELPGAGVAPPDVEYFVEVLGDRAGADAAEPEPIAVIGAPDRPVHLAVDASVEEPKPDRVGRSRITMFLDYVDFDGGGAGGYDQYLHGEVDFRYRFRGTVDALRLGFGSITGVGGPTDVIDDAPDGDCRDQFGVYRCRKVGFTYTFVELEFKLNDVVALMVRPTAGGAYRDEAPPDATDVARIYSSAIGLRTRLRFGHEDETNLVIGAGLTEDVGTTFEAVFTWDVIHAFPIVLAAQVTDQPVIENYGVRMIADVGWRGLSWVYPSARVSYQARDINHTGVSGGVAVNFDW